MKKQKTWMVWMGAAALIVLVSRAAQVTENKEIVPTPMQTVEEPARVVAETAGSDDVDFGEQAHETIQIIEDAVVEIPETTKSSEEDAEENHLIVPESRPIIAEAEEQIVAENASLPDGQGSESEPLTPLESQEVQEMQEIGAEEVDAIEDSLSVGDYARGLSLLAKLPVETVDRFVALRKDGFTAEEQAEVKEILISSFEGDDLAWIVETYHKLQP